MKETSMNSNSIDILYAHPIRIIPFDLGRDLTDEDIGLIDDYLCKNVYTKLLVTPRQSSILKDCERTYNVNSGLSLYLYRNGIVVFVIMEEVFKIEDVKRFSIPYGENRKKAHSDLFSWKHVQSQNIWDIIEWLRERVKENTKSQRLRSSASTNFENRGMSYIMTLSLFDWNNKNGSSFKDYPESLQRWAISQDLMM